MKVLIWPAGDENHGSAQYRLLQPARCLQDLGYDVSWTIGRGPVLGWDKWFNPNEPPPEWVKVTELSQRPDADVVVLQRPGRRWWADCIPFIQREGIRVVVDVDDRFDMIHPRNGAHFEFDPRNSPIMNHRWIAEACRLADVVTCTTQSLKDRYGYGHGIVLPNLVPESYLKIPHQPAVRTIGWSGHVGTHPDDLQMTGGAVGRVLQENPTWRFLSIGDPYGVRKALELAHDPLEIGWAPFHEYAQEMSKMMVGIVPLTGTVFNSGKSSLKMAEMAAVGVPVVVSPTEDHIRLNKLGVGLLANSPNQWVKRLKTLIKNPDYREELSGRGREVMASQTYEGHCERWWMAWTGSKAMMKAS